MVIFHENDFEVFIDPDGDTHLYYELEINENTGKLLPEYNWVWSPQSVIDMHRPETWGYVQFADQEHHPEHTDFIENKDESIKWALRQLYYRQHAFFKKRQFLKLLGQSAVTITLADVLMQACTSQHQKKYNKQISAAVFPRDRIFAG